MAKERNEKMGELIMKGDIVAAYSYNNYGRKILFEYEVKEIISQDFWGQKPEGDRTTDWGYYLEFIGNDDKYHYWKQRIDGGHVYAKEVA